MDTSDYIKAARLGNGKYRISNVHIRNTGADDLDGEGTIEFSKNGFISKISIKSPNVKIPMLTIESMHLIRESSLRYLF